MSRIIHSIFFIAITIFSTFVSAADSIYSLGSIATLPTPHYPGLDLSTVTSAKAEISYRSDDPQEKTLDYLEINFAGAAKFSASDFQRIGIDRYRAVKKSAWIYDEIIVEVDSYFHVDPSNITVRIYVSDLSSSLNPIELNQGAQILELQAITTDITPTQTVDIATATIDGASVELKLQDRLGRDINQVPGYNEGFIVETLWMGRGQKTIYLSSPVPVEMGHQIEPIGLILEPQGNDYLISVKYLDQNGAYQTVPHDNLGNTLDMVYGPEQ